MPRSVRTPLAALVGALCALLLPCALASGAAHTKSECGKRRIALPAPGAAAVAAPLVLGDSVLYDAVPSLAAAGFEANGMICRRIDQGLAILRTRKKAGTLPSLVVLELGANWIVTTAQIQDALSILGPGRSLVMLTPTDDDPPLGRDAKTIKRAAAKWPTRLRALDWATDAKAHPEWMAKDGVHLANADGVAGLVAMIRQALTPPSPAPASPAVTAPGNGGAGGATAPSA